MSYSLESQTKYRKSHPEQVRTTAARFYVNHRDEVRAENARRNRQYRQEALEAYGGHCACCGEEQYEFLAIDHIDGGGNEHRRTVGGRGSQMIYWLRANSYPKGFQVLCHNCNSAKGFYGECPHLHSIEASARGLTVTRQV